MTLGPRPPKKWLDADRTDINPEWLAWRDARDRAVCAGFGPGSAGVYFPEEEGKAIPDGGCWIRILEEPHTELKQRFRVPILSMWFARPHVLNSGGYGRYRPRQAVIATPGGDLHLWAHEYVIVDDIRPYLGAEPHAVLRHLDGGPVFDADAEERLFYLQSRGITRNEAALLLVDDLERPGFYLTMHEDYVETFRGVGIPLWRHMALNPRSSGRDFSVALVDESH